MTELTPMMMPSIVSRLRHLDIRRLETAVLKLPLHILLPAPSAPVTALFWLSSAFLRRLIFEFLRRHLVHHGRYAGSYIVIVQLAPLKIGLAGTFGHIADCGFFIAGYHAV